MHLFPDAGKYSASGVEEPCDLVYPEALRLRAEHPQGEPRSSVHTFLFTGAGTLDCEVHYVQGAGDVSATFSMFAITEGPAGAE